MRSFSKLILLFSTFSAWSTFFKNAVIWSTALRVDEAEAASYILKELRDRLRQTHKLRAVK